MNTLSTQSPIVPGIVEIDLVRHEHFFFYNRREDGQSTVTARRIPVERARQIYEANEGNDWQQTRGQVSFEAAPCEWSWTTRIAV